MSSQSLNPEKCAICGCIEAMSAHHGANVGFVKAHEFKRGEPAAAAPPLTTLYCANNCVLPEGHTGDCQGASPSDPVQPLDIEAVNEWLKAETQTRTNWDLAELLAAYDQHRNQKLWRLCDDPACDRDPAMFGGARMCTHQIERDLEAYRDFVKERARAEDLDRRLAAALDRIAELEKEK